MGNTHEITTSVVVVAIGAVAVRRVLGKCILGGRVKHEPIFVAVRRVPSEGIAGRAVNEEAGVGVAVRGVPGQRVAISAGKVEAIIFVAARRVPGQRVAGIVKREALSVVVRGVPGQRVAERGDKETIVVAGRSVPGERIRVGTAGKVEAIEEPLDNAILDRGFGPLKNNPVIVFPHATYGVPGAVEG